MPKLPAAESHLGGSLIVVGPFWLSQMRYKFIELPYIFSMLEHISKTLEYFYHLLGRIDGHL